MFSIPARSQTQYTTGSQYFGGTIFYVDETKRHGLVVGDYDLGNWGGDGSSASPGYETQWPLGGSYSPVYLGTDTSPYTGIYGGKAATQLFVDEGTSRWQGVLEGYNTSGSYSDWYLPNKEELFTLMKTYWYDNSGTIPNMYNPPFDPESPSYGTVQEYTTNPTTTLWYWFSTATPPYMDDIAKSVSLKWRPIRRF